MKPKNVHSILELKEVNVAEGVKLRPLDQSDAKRILEILNSDSNIRNRVTVASRLYTVKDVTDEIQFYHSDMGLIRYTLLKDNKPVGLVSLWRDDGFFGTKPNPDDYGFGYFLDPAERGKGLTSKAIQSLMRVITKGLRVRQFVAFCTDQNKESIAVLTKMGFKPTTETYSEPTHGWIERKYVRSTT